MTTNRSNAVSGDRWVIETDGLLLKNVTGYVVRHDLFFVQISQYPTQSRISNELYNCSESVLIRTPGIVKGNKSLRIKTFGLV